MLSHPSFAPLPSPFVTRKKIYSLPFVTILIIRLHLLDSVCFFIADPLLIIVAHSFLPSSISVPFGSSFLFDLPPIAFFFRTHHCRYRKLLHELPPTSMSKLAVTPVNKPTGLMRRHPSIRAPDRSPFGSISEGVKVQLHYLPPAAFIVDHSPPAFHRGNSVGEPDREGAKITPFPDEESLQTFEDARIAVQDDDPFGGGHRQLSKNIVPNASSPVAPKRSDFFGSQESIRPQLSSDHLQGHRHSSASGLCGPQLLQQASRSASIEKMPPPSDIIQQKGERVSRSMRPLRRRLIFTVVPL